MSTTASAPAYNYQLYNQLFLGVATDSAVPAIRSVVFTNPVPIAGDGIALDNLRIATPVPEPVPGALLAAAGLSWQESRDKLFPIGGGRDVEHLPIAESFDGRGRVRHDQRCQLQIAQQSPLFINDIDDVEGLSPFAVFANVRQRFSGGHVGADRNVLRRHVATGGVLGVAE